MVTALRMRVSSGGESFNALHGTQQHTNWWNSAGHYPKMREPVTSECLYRLSNSGRISSTAWSNHPSLKKARCYSICFQSWLLQQKLLRPRATTQIQVTLPKIRFQPEKSLLEIYTTMLSKFWRLLGGRARKSTFREGEPHNITYISATLESGL